MTWNAAHLDKGGGKFETARRKECISNVFLIKVSKEEHVQNREGKHI